MVQLYILQRCMNARMHKCMNASMHIAMLHATFFKIYLGILQIQHLVKGAESRFIQN